MIWEILSGSTRAILYIILAGLFWEKKKIKFIHFKTLFIIMLITFVYFISNMHNFEWTKGFLPIEVMGILLLYGVIDKPKIKGIYWISGAIGAYIFSFIINAIIASTFGWLAYFIDGVSHVELKYFIGIVFRLGVCLIICMNYELALKQAEKKVTNVIMVIGAFVIFFQYFFQTAYIDKNYSFAMIVVLLLYLTMIFTAFMLLQHNRLTAKQQAIEEDNRQMSQRLHRSKDVLGVVSQVVASEDHIDPKLRKELADFCDDEMNEMQDRALGANLIGDTGIELVNVMLQKQMIRCADLNISFDVMIPAPIDGYIREIGISVTEFMRMLNDLLKNAVKAILSSDNTHRELLLIMGEAGNDCFEIRLYDSGVPFPPKILEHLGERGNTTDGTGNGIADTVETLRHYRASFVIEPIEPGTDIYTKCIHIAFDGQGCLPQNGEQ